MPVVPWSKTMVKVHDQELLEGGISHVLFQSSYLILCYTYEIIEERLNAPSRPVDSASLPCRTTAVSNRAGLFFPGGEALITSLTSSSSSRLAGWNLKVW